MRRHGSRTPSPTCSAALQPAILLLAIALDVAIHVHAAYSVDHIAEGFTSDVGVLPLVMASQLQPSRMSLQLLQRARSGEEAAIGAREFQTALLADKDAVLHNLFVSWSGAYNRRYSSLREAEQAFVAFTTSVECLLHHNAQRRPSADASSALDTTVDTTDGRERHASGNSGDSGGGGGSSHGGDGGSSSSGSHGGSGGDSSDGSGGSSDGGGAWYTLNAYSATPRRALAGVIPPPPSPRPRPPSPPESPFLPQPPSPPKPPSPLKPPYPPSLPKPPSLSSSPLPPRPHAPPSPRGHRWTLLCSLVCTKHTTRLFPALCAVGKPPHRPHPPPAHLRPQRLKSPSPPKPPLPKLTVPTPPSPHNPPSPPSVPPPKLSPPPPLPPPTQTGAPRAPRSPRFPRWPNPPLQPSPPPSRPPAPQYSTAVLYRTRKTGGTPTVTLPPPPSVDWSKTGRLTPVKDQGANCASCWVNSAVSAVEAALSIAHSSKPIEFSRQILVDCANQAVAGDVFVHDMGCFGGDPANALFFMSRYTIPTEEAYPYISSAIGMAGVCNISMMALPPSDGTWLQVGAGAIFYQANSEIHLQASVAVQPVVIYWNMGANFNIYTGGMYDLAHQTDPAYGCSTDIELLNHVMMLVGYNAASRYWIIQNSFGVGWGEGGFIRVRMTNTTQGPCGMYSYVVAPTFNFKRVPRTVAPDAATSPPLPPPAPPSPPPPGCPAELSSCASSLDLQGPARFLQACNGVSFRAKCPCSCKGLGYCNGETDALCYGLFTSDFCAAVDGTSRCSCWCGSGMPPLPPLPLPPLPPLPPKSPSPRPSPPPSPVKAALLSLRDALQPQGSVLTYMADWRVDTDPCSPAAPWSLVTCAGTAGSAQTVIALNMSGLQLSGTLPAEISALSTLQTLDVSSNTFSGVLPVGVSSLVELTLLDISFNTFTGTVPLFVTAMTNLEFLIVNTNALSGKLPPAYSVLTELYYLDLSNNGLTGTLPAKWSRLTNLLVLSLEANLFTGTLPPSYSVLTILFILDLSSNSLTGPLPAAWSRLTGLQTMTLADNVLTGTLPPSWCSMKKMDIGSLDLSNNIDVTGTVPQCATWTKGAGADNLKGTSVTL